MKIAEYNDMMSYLTRPAPQTQVADLVDDLEPGALKDELLEKFDPSQETYEEYLRRERLGERPFNASDGGRANLKAGTIPGGYTDDAYNYIREIDIDIKNAFKKYKAAGGKLDFDTYSSEAKRAMFAKDTPAMKAEGGRVNLADGTEEIVEPSKSMQVDTTTKGIPDPLEEFKKQADVFLQGSFASTNKEFFNSLIQKEYDKALEAGVLPEEALSFLKQRSQMYRTLAEEGRMQGEPAILGPSYGRENKAIGGFIKGLYIGIKGLQQGKIAKQLINKYRDEGMDFINAITKGNQEAEQIVKNRKLKVIQDKFNETNVLTDDYVKLIDEEIKLNDPELFKDIRKFEKNNRSDLADKMRALRHPDWAEANFGEDYQDVLQQRQSIAIKQMMDDIDPNVKERTVVEDIDDMNQANINEFFGRKKNADGGRIELAIGGGVIEGEDLGTREGFNRPNLKKATKETRSLYNDEKLVSKIIELTKKEPENYDSLLKKINSYKGNEYKYSANNLSNVIRFLAEDNRIDPKYKVNKQGTPVYVVNKRNAKIDELVNVDPDKLPTAQSIGKKLGVSTTTVTDYLKKSKGEDWLEQNYGKERFKRYGDIPLRKQFLNYVLNNPVEKFTFKNIIKNTDIKTRKEANSIYSKLLADIYDKRAPNIDRPVQYIDENINLKDLTKKLRSSDDFYDIYERRIGSLLLEAYDGNLDSKEYKNARKTLTAYHNLIRPLNKKYPSIAQTIEHPIPYTFLTEVAAGKDPKNLINTTILGDKENTFKSKIDEVKIKLRRNLEKNPNDKKLLAQVEDMKKLETFLTKETGMGFGVVKSRFTDPRVQDLDFGAETFGTKKIVPQIEESLNVRKNVVDFYNKFKNSDEVKKLFENAGVGVKVFRMLGGIRKGNVPLFLKQMNEILEKNPGLKDQLTQLNVFDEDDRILLASLDGQSGTMTDFYSGPNLTAEEKDPLPYEAALPAGVALGKYGPQILNALKGVGKVGLKTVGSLPAAATFAGTTIKENLDEGKNIADAVVDPLVGIELLLPETVKKLGPLMARAARVSTPVGATITGLGTLKDRTLGMMRDAEALAATQPNEQQQKLIEEFAAQQYRGYELGGRVGFADGPEDPSKRNFMKILGGLASLPLVGRFFKIGEKAAPIIDAVKTEAVKGKPEWFDALVNKVIRMGEDVTDRFATVDREIVNQIDIADGETVRVYRNVDEGTVRVEYENPDNMGEGSVDLVYKKPNPDEGDPNPSANFYATELEPRGIRTGPDDYDIEFDGENYADSVDELMSDTTKLKEFATGQKRTMKEIVESKKKKDKTKAMNESTMEQAEYLETKYGPGDEGDYFQDFSDYD